MSLLRSLSADIWFGLSIKIMLAQYGNG